MDPPLPTLITFVFLLALPMSLALSGLVGWRFRASVGRLMRLAPPPSDATAAADFVSSLLPQAKPDQPSRRSQWRLSVALAALSLLIGITTAVLYLMVHFGGITPLRLLITSLVLTTPGLVLQAQILCWPLRLQLLVAASWGLVLLLLVRLASIAFELGPVAVWIALHLGIPLVVLGILFGIPRLRAIVPYLFPPIFLLAFLSSLGLQLLVGLVNVGSGGVLEVLLRMAGAGGTILVFIVLPVVLAMLPAHSLTSFLGRLYRAKAFSDLSYLYGASWFLILLLQVIPGWNVKATDAWAWDVRPLVPLLAWLWIPVFFAAYSRFAQTTALADPPTLLVLRVFRRSSPVGWLFDNVVQRWRAIGPVLLISAADLASRTIEPDELVSFLEGRLRDRYILDADDLRRHLSEIDAAPDHDGRYRVTDFCCYASSWKQTLDALLTRSNSVLMDLRGFSEQNQGCLYELRRISQAFHLTRVVLLADAKTDRGTAEEVLHAYPNSPLVKWVSAPKKRLSRVNQLVDYLLAPGG